MQSLPKDICNHILQFAKYSLQVTMTATKTVLITGSSRGIGLQLTNHYVSSGWNVIATARKPETAHKLKELSPWKLVQLDTSDEQSILRAAAELESVPIDVLINNAGILEGGALDVTTKADLMHQFEVNVTGPFLVTRALLPNLKLSTNNPFVVVITSSMGSLEMNSEGNMFAGGYYGYRASKAALNMVIRSLVVDLKGQSIGFLPLHPGYVSTDANGNPDDAMSVETSVDGMSKVIANFTFADSGKFVNNEGSLLPW